MITHGAADAVVNPAVIGRQMSSIPSRKVEMMDTGHACFWDDAIAYNTSLRRFSDDL